MKRHLILTLAVLASAFLFASCAQSPEKMTKKEIMDAFVAGTLDPDYVPSAFFIHFAKDAKVGQKAVDAHLNYFRESGADILKVQFEQYVPWVRGLETKEDWANIEPVAEDHYRPTVEIIKALQDSVGTDVYVVPTVYSAFQVLRQAIREPYILKAAQENPEDLKRVLASYNDALIWFVNACKEIGIEGFYMPTQGGEMRYYGVPEFYEDIVKPEDLRLMNCCTEGTKMNFLHICDWEGTYDDLLRYKDFPGQIVNTPIDINGTKLSLSEAEAIFNRPVLGGLERKKEITNGTVDEVVSAVRRIINDGPKGRMMVGADCTVSDAPMENIKAAIATAHGK